VLAGCSGCWPCGLAVHDTGALPLKHCPHTARLAVLRVAHLLVGWSPAALVGPIGTALRLGFVLLQGLIAWLLRPLLMRPHGLRPGVPGENSEKLKAMRV
jgi:hypothetical protein